MIQGLCFILFGVPLWLIYWNLFVPILLVRIRYRLFRSRDELRMLLINGSIGEKEKAYRIVESLCNCGIRTLGQIDLVDLFWRKRTDTVELEGERSLKLIHESDPKIRELAADVGMSIAGGAVAMSPVFLILFFLAAAILWFGVARKWASKFLIRALGNFSLQPA